MQCLNCGSHNIQTVSDSQGFYTYCEDCDAINCADGFVDYCMYCGDLAIPNDSGEAICVRCLIGSEDDFVKEFK